MNSKSNFPSTKNRGTLPTKTDSLQKTAEPISKLNEMVNSSSGKSDAANYLKLDGIAYYSMITNMLRYGLHSEYGIPYTDQLITQSNDTGNSVKFVSSNGLNVYDPNAIVDNNLRGLFATKNTNGTDTKTGNNVGDRKAHDSIYNQEFDNEYCGTEDADEFNDDSHNMRMDDFKIDYDD